MLRGASDEDHTLTVFDAENRGGPSVLGLVTGVNLRAGAPSEVTYPQGLGPGCLFDLGVGYARVQWQTGHAESVPVYAQGVGLVSVRDMARLLADGGEPLLGRHPRLVLSGASQSAWFVNTFVAEGFNADPVSGGPVFAGALPYLSAGNWLAINRLVDDGRPQDPYVRPEGVPLTAPQVLTAGHRPVPGRRVQLHGVLPHAPACPGGRHCPTVPAATTCPARTPPDRPTSQRRRSTCSAATTGWQSRSTRRTARLMYALLVGLANQVGAGIDGPTLPPSRSFELRPRPAAGPHFNALHGRRSAGTPGRRRCAATRRRAHPRRGAAAQAARAGGAVAVRHEVDHRRVQLRGLAAVRR